MLQRKLFVSRDLWKHYGIGEATWKQEDVMHVKYPNLLDRLFQVFLLMYEVRLVSLVMAYFRGRKSFKEGRM